MAERAKQDPKVQRLISEVRNIGELTDHPGWQILRRKVEEEKDQFLLRVAKRLMAGYDVSTLEIDYKRGYYQGALDTLLRPEKAWENLEKAARRAWLRQSEMLSEKEGEVPYA